MRATLRHGSREHDGTDEQTTMAICGTAPLLAATKHPSIYSNRLSIDSGDGLQRSVLHLPTDQLLLFHRQHVQALPRVSTLRNGRLGVTLVLVVNVAYVGSQGTHRDGVPPKGPIGSVL